MILSVSRRTNIPRFYFDWFLNRLREGYALVRNPMNHRQVGKITLTPDTVDCIAFWSKNPAPMLPKLEALEPYPYFVQFALNPYGRDIESGLPDKSELLDTFLSLSETIGPERVVWRYSPVLINRSYTIDRHLRCFESFAARLKGYTTLCRLSFLDIYAKIAPRMRGMGITDVPETEKPAMAKALAQIAQAHGITLGGCGNMDLDACGLAPVGCIDAGHVSRITGTSLSSPKDPGQRGNCHCAQSIDIGTYNTCINGCAYCYANHSQEAAVKRYKAYDPHSPMLCDQPVQGDIVTERKVKTSRDNQRRLF